MVENGRRRVNFTSKNRKMQMNDPWTRSPISELREKAARDGRAGAQGGRVISRSLLLLPPLPFLGRGVKKNKKSKKDGEKNEEGKETGGRKSRKTNS